MDQQPRTRNRCIGSEGVHRRRPWARRKRGKSVHGQNARGTGLVESGSLRNHRGRAMSGVHAPNALHAHAPRHCGLADAGLRAGSRERVRPPAGNAVDEHPAGTLRGAQEDVRRVWVRDDSPGGSPHAAADPGGSPHVAADRDGGHCGLHCPGDARDHRDGRHRARAVRTQERLLLEQVLKRMRRRLQLSS